MNRTAYPISNNLFNVLELGFNLSEGMKELKKNLIRTGDKVYVLESVGRQPHIHAIINSELNGAFTGCSHKEPYLRNDKSHVTSIDCHKVTLYQCEFCSFITDAKGIYLKHIFSDHNRHFLEVARSEHEVKSLRELLPKDFQPEADNNIIFEVDEIDHIKAKWITDDYDNFDIIEITRDFNSYGVCTFTVEITMYDTESMLITGDSLQADGALEDCTEKQADKQYYAANRKADKNSKKWMALPDWGDNPKCKQPYHVYPDIVSETRDGGYGTFEQEYMAVTIKFTIQDVDLIRCIIGAREVTYQQYQAANSVNW